MKKRYPVQGDRFSACMSIYHENNQGEKSHSNPGEKFEDPMLKQEDELDDPIKPLLP